MSTTTANMSLIVPASGDSDYPSSISSSLNTLDAHTHASGSGVQIPTGGIADNAITTAKINALAVTTAKIAANNVTRAKLEAVGQQVSSDVAYSASATSYTDVTNASISITTTGRPVVVAFIPDSSGVGYILIETTSALNAAIDVKALRGATKVYEATSLGVLLQTTTAGAVGTPQIVLPPSSVHFIDVPAAGTYTYKLQAQKASGSATSSGNYVFAGRLIAYEL